MTTEFAHLNLHPSLVQAVSDLGYKTPTEVQERVIPLMNSGKDVIAQSQTGSGKTAAFALPILQNFMYVNSYGSVQHLVLAPTRELAIQVADAIQKYGRHTDIKVMAVYGGQHYGTSKRRLREGVDVIAGTPGRMLDLIRQNILDLSGVHTVVLDEADEMLSMGFIEDIESILNETPAKRQTTLFSATMPHTIRKLADRYMNEPQFVEIKRKQLTVATTEQRYYIVKERDKLAAMTRLFEAENIGTTLVFTRTRANSGLVANQLTQRGFPAEVLNGDLSQDARLRVLNRFKSGQVKVLVATDVAARGLDIDDITHVFNYDISNDPEAYVHRIGRTGRAGKEGIAISLVTPNESRRLGRIEHYTKQKMDKAELPTPEEIIAGREAALMEKFNVWLERDRCKREQEMVEALVAEGHDPIKVAAVALKMARAEEKQRPIEKISKAVAKPRREKSRRRKKSDNRNNKKQYKRSGKGSNKQSHEEGMVRLSMNLGRMDGVSPSEVVGTIASNANIPGYAIGKILIQNEQTLVDIPEEHVSRVLGQNGAYSIRDHQHLMITKA